MNYELHEFKSGQTYINLVDFFTVNFLFPLPYPLLRTANLANLREFEKDETGGIILDNALTEDNGYLSEHNHSGKATMIITPVRVY